MSLNGLLLAALTRTPPGWQPCGVSTGDSLVQLTVAVRMDGVDELETALHSVSDPRSAEYGNHWTLDAITQVTHTKPRAEAVANWLRPYAHHMHVTTTGDFIRMWSSLAQTEALLGCTLHCHRHEFTGAIRWSSVEQMQQLPPHHPLAGMVDFIDGVDLPVVRRARSATEPSAWKVEAGVMAGAAAPPHAAVDGGDSAVTVPVVEARDRAFMAHVLLHNMSIESVVGFDARATCERSEPSARPLVARALNETRLETGCSAGPHARA
jgi:hypothetical protein